MCPPPPDFGTCVELCGKGNECEDGFMCCSNGCGHTCQKPVEASEPKCCDPREQPGTNGFPLCKENYACCPLTGEWVCSIGDGKTFPCDGSLISGDELGEACTITKGPPILCCEPDDRPLCLIGNAACCPTTGDWSCPNGFEDEYLCGDRIIGIDEAGDACPGELHCTAVCNLCVSSGVSISTRTRIVCGTMR